VDEHVPEVPEVLHFMVEQQKMGMKEAYGTLKLGIGYVAIVKPHDVDQVFETARVAGFEAFDAGVVECGEQEVIVPELGISYHHDESGFRKDCSMPGKHVLAILGHPDAGSFNHAIVQRYISSLPRDCEVRTLMLGELDFDPVLRFGYRQRMAPDPVVTRSQELLLWADHVVLVFPCWWTGVPSLLKGWFERVLTPGFAYNEDNSGLLSLGMRTEKHLAGRTATLIATYHGPSWYFTLNGFSPVRVVKQQILGLCGIRTTQTLQLSWVDSPKKDSQARREAFLDRVARAAAGLG
jgi:NAD(P)H dehydrogenase (quinone)